MDINNWIVENIDNPHELEKMYRKDPKAFKSHSHMHGNKILILKFWVFGMKDCISRRRKIQGKLP